MVSVHDNLVYGQAVDYDGCRVVLHTVYPHADPPEYTDIVFAGVAAYHVEQQAFRGSGVSANVVFDAEEFDPAIVLGRYTELRGSWSGTGSRGSRGACTSARRRSRRRRSWWR